MTCPSPITHSMYADGALTAPEAAALELHAATCAACSARIEALRFESAALRAALRTVEIDAPIPRFAAPARARDFVALALGILLVAGLSSAFWNVVTTAIPSGLRWLNPLEPGELFERGLDALTFVVYEGSAMWTTAVNFLGVATALALLGWLSAAAVRNRGTAAIAASVLALVVALPSIGHAFERRHESGLVTVAAGETINDTLFAAGDTVSIDGNVNGDLLAFGRRVTVRGNVAGNLITGAETVRIEGTVGGSIIGGARGLSLANARVGRDFYGFGRDVDIESNTNVTGNAIAFGENIDLDGRVGVDFAGFARTVTVSGAVDGDVEGHAATLTLLPSARVGGNVTGHVDSAGDLNVASGAVIGGAVDEQLVERERRRNRYLTVGYYGGQVVRLGAMFVAGALLLWLFPVLREVSLPNAAAVLRSGGIGLAAAVTLPVAALLLCITIIGLPLGALTFVLGFIGLFFSKPVIAQIIGSGVLRDAAQPPHYLATLITGLVIVIVAINLPFVGGIANIVLTLVGFGVIVSLLLARLNRGSLA